MEEAREYAFVMGDCGDNEGSKLPVNIKVEVGAKAELKGEIPSSSLGRAVDAVADAIRIWTTPRELRPELIKLQRAEIALKVTKIGQKLLEKRGHEVRPVPAKALIPILEKASLEEAESELLEAWGRLLASASSNFDIEVVTFADILSVIGPREARIIQEMIGAYGLDHWADRKKRATASPGFDVYDNPDVIKPMVLSAIKSEDHSVFKNLRRFFPPNYPIHVTKLQKGVATERANKIDTIFESNFFSANAAGFEILEKQGLIQQRYAGFSWQQNSDDGPSGVSWYELTELGFAFAIRVSNPKD